MSGPRKGRRQLARLDSDLSERDRAILLVAVELRLVSTRQIERRLFTVPRDHVTALSAARSCRRTLERLVRDRMLVRSERRIGGVRAGSAAFVYAIGPVGERVLGTVVPRRRFREPSPMFLAHTLAASELYVQLHEAADGDRFKLISLEAEPRCWRSSTGLGGRLLLKPDLFVVLATGEYEYRWFVEVDLGTEHTPALLRKCQAYETYYQSGVEQAEHGVFPRVLWVTPDEERAEHIRRVIERDSHLTPALFVATSEKQAVYTLAGGRP